MNALVLLAALAPQTTWYVDASATAPGAGSLASPYTSIGYAMAQPTTVSGDTVSVAPGTYIDELIDFAGKEVHLVSQAGAAQTIVMPPSIWPPPPNNSTIQMTSGEGPGAIVEGFRFEGGSGTVMTAPIPAGGALLAVGAQPQIRNCEFHGCLAPLGGALYFESCDGLVTGCTFSSSAVSAVGQGAAIFADGGTLRVESCVVQDLISTNGITYLGGALAARNCNVSIRSSQFSNCDGSWVNGGALSLDACIAFVADTEFRDCHCSQGDGGAIATRDSITVLESVLAKDNSTFDGSGGAICIRNGQFSVYDSTFADNISDDHAGGAILNDQGSLLIDGCRFERNLSVLGGAIYQATSISQTSSLTVVDSIFEENQAMGLSFPIPRRGGAILGAGLIERSVFIANVGGGQGSSIDGGAAIHGDAVARQCTFISNPPQPLTETGAVAGVTLEDCIVVGSGPTPLVAGSTATYSLIEGGFPGVGNTTGDPRFWSPDDVHLLPGSPAIDAGNPTATFDPDGTRRDIGAITFDPFYCGPGCIGPQGSNHCPGLPNSSGRIASLSALGSELATDNLLILIGEDLPSGAVGYMLGSRQSSFVPFFGGSQGVLCVGGSILRFSNTVFTATPGGVIAFQPDLLNLPGGNTAMSGDTWFFQAWYRDMVGGTLTSNTTTGLEASFQ